MAEHWRSEDDADGIRWLSLDKAESTTNVLSRRVLGELRDLVEAIAADPPSGVVIRSAKDSGFILGADITEFEHVTGIEEAEALAREGQALFARLEALPCPTVAAISGFALGGGLELALACDYRVAAQGYERSIGLPEVQLGIHPGFGGTVRSVRLLGAPLAMDLMLTGRSVSPMEALRAGLVDELAEDARLDQAARHLLQRRPPKRRAPLYLRILDLKPLPILAGAAPARPRGPARAPRALPCPVCDRGTVGAPRGVGCGGLPRRSPFDRRAALQRDVQKSRARVLSARTPSGTRQARLERRARARRGRRCHEGATSLPGAPLTA